MFTNVFRFIFCVSFALLTHAQTSTIPNGAGGSIVVAVTTDPGGLPVTQTIATLPPAGQQTATTATPVPPPGAPPAAPPTTASPTTASTATTQTTTAAPAVTTDRGPVGQPDPTPNSAGGVTPFTYTTVINGVTTAVADNFTPTNPKTVPFTPTGTGTIMDFSQFLSSFGGPQATGAASNAGHHVSVSNHLPLLILSFFMIRYALLL